jgi:hypothetical protein
VIRQHLSVFGAAPHVVVHCEDRFDQTSVAVVRNWVAELVLELVFLQLLDVLCVLVKDVFAGFLLLIHLLLPVELLVGRD